MPDDRHEAALRHVREQADALGRIESLRESAQRALAHLLLLARADGVSDDELAAASGLGLDGVRYLLSTVEEP